MIMSREDHFAGATKMVQVGSGIERPIVKGWGQIATTLSKQAENGVEVVTNCHGLKCAKRRMLYPEVSEKIGQLLRNLQRLR